MGGNMIKVILSAICLLNLFGCATSENQIKEFLKKNPKIVFDIIEENPEQFIEVVNRAAQKAQQKQYEKQISDMKAEQERDIKNPKKPVLNDDRLLIGKKSGDIVIVEYADFQCPACKMAFESLNQFKSKYKDRIQFYYKHMPLDFHKMAYPAAQYFEAIKIQNKEKALKFYNLVFQNQKELNSISFLEKVAKQVGADISKVKIDVSTERIQKIINEDMTEFQQFGFTGTPVIVLNGVALHGAQKIEELERVMSLTTK